MPNPGDIGLYRIPGLVGKLIWAGQWLYGTGSHWTHAFIVLDDGQVIGARPGGAFIEPLNSYKKTDIIFMAVPRTDEQSRAIVTYAKALAGTPYSFLDYFAMFLHRFKINLPWVRNRIQSSKHLICSQLDDLSYQMSGVKLFDDGRWPGYVSPGALANLGKVNGWLVDSDGNVVH